MNKIDWMYYIILAVLAGFLIGGIFMSGCAILQRKDTPTIAPAPSVQLWQTVKKSNWLVTLAIPIIALGTVAMFNGAAKLGMSAVIFGCVNLFMALATARFALWMSVFGLIGSVAAVAMSILARKRALVDIIKGGEKFKVAANIAEVDVKTGFNRVQDSIQSNSTKKIVQNIKADLKIKGKI